MGLSVQGMCMCVGRVCLFCSVLEPNISCLCECVCVREVSYTQGKALQDLHYGDMELCVTTTSSWRGTALQKTQSAEIISHQTAHIPHYQNLHQFVLCNIWKSTVGLL